MTERYRLRIVLDHDTERPDSYMIGRMVSFSTRHANYAHPDSLDDDEVLAYLSYSEHGRCKWRVLDDPRPLGIDHWDDVTMAGAIVWNGDDSEREWWNGQTDEKRLETLRGIASEFTSWANGDCFGYILERITVCDKCGQEVTEDVDSCFGFIGLDFLDWADVEYPDGVTKDDCEIIEAA